MRSTLQLQAEETIKRETGLTFEEWVEDQRASGASHEAMWLRIRDLGIEVSLRTLYRWLGDPAADRREIV